MRKNRSSRACQGLEARQGTLAEGPRGEGFTTDVRAERRRGRGAQAAAKVSQCSGNRSGLVSCIAPCSAL